MKLAGVIVALAAFVAISIFFLTRPPRNATLHREWVSVALQGGGYIRLILNPGDTFEMEMGETKERIETKVRGTYVLADSPPNPFNSAASKVLDLSMDEESAKRLKYPASEIEQARKAGRKIPFHRLIFDPAIPVLTDILTMHLVPADEIQAASTRLQEQIRRSNPALNGK